MNSQWLTANSGPGGNEQQKHYRINMKNKFKLLILTAAYIAATSIATHAQSWDTIFVLGDPNNSPVGNAVLIDPFSANPSFPELFLGGGSSFGPVLNLDQSTDPVTVMPSDAAYGRAQRLGSDAAGNLYSVGYENRANRLNWQVRTSADTGVTWAVRDDAVQWNPNNHSVAYGVAADPSGNIFVTGVAQDKKGASYWVIRKGANHGQTWTTVFSSSKPIAHGDGLRYLPPVPGKHDGGLFAVGRLTPGKATQGTVLRSRDAGNSWQTVDAWVPGKNQTAGATAVTSDANGNLFVAGSEAADAAWYVRVSGDAGNSWQTILTGYSAGTMINRPNDMATDAAGNLYVVGVTSASGKATWTVRRWDAATQTWDQWPNALRYPLTPEVSVSVARGVTADATGRVYATGSGDSQWITQRLSVP
jgi:hypothetical protein